MSDGVARSGNLLKKVSVVFPDSKFGPTVSKIPGSAPVKLLDILHKSQIGFLANNRTEVVVTVTGYFSKRDWQISYN